MPLGRTGGRENSGWEGEKSLEEIRKEQRARAARPPGEAGRGAPAAAGRGCQPRVPAAAGRGGVPCPAPRDARGTRVPSAGVRGKGAVLAAHRTCRSRQPGAINACIVLRLHRAVSCRGRLPGLYRRSRFYTGHLCVSWLVVSPPPHRAAGREGGRGERRLWRRSGAGAQPVPGMPSRSWGWGA